jgi:hypothetical protein
MLLIIAYRNGWLIDWCFTHILAIFQLYRGVNKLYNSLRHLQDPHIEINGKTNKYGLTSILLFLFFLLKYITNAVNYGKSVECVTSDDYYDAVCCFLVSFLWHLCIVVTFLAWHFFNHQLCEMDSRITIYFLVD